MSLDGPISLWACDLTKEATAARLVRRVRVRVEPDTPAGVGESADGRSNKLFFQAHGGQTNVHCPSEETFAAADRPLPAMASRTRYGS